MANRAKKLGPRVTVSVTPSNFKTLSTLAERNSVSISWVIRRAINEYLQQHGETQPPQKVPTKRRASATGRI